MITKTNKFLLELFNVPEKTVASDLTLANSDILSWTLDSVEFIKNEYIAKKSEYIAKITVTMKEFVETDFLDGNIGLSAVNHEVLGTDLYIHEIEGTTISLNDGNDH